MKKLIIIMLLIPIFATAQIEFSDDYSFKPDKKLHVKVAAGISASIYAIGYCKTKEARGSCRAAWIFPLIPIIGKEFVDVAAGGEFSLSDIAYGEGSALLTSASLYGLTKLLERLNKKIRIRRQIKQIRHDLACESWSLDNEFLNNK